MTAIRLDEPALAALRGLVQGAVGVAIHAAPRSKQDYSGGDSAVRRMLQTVEAARSTEAAVRLRFAPGETAHVAMISAACRRVVYPHLRFVAVYPTGHRCRSYQIRTRCDGLVLDVAA